MHTIDTGGLENIKTFDQLLPWLRDNLNWPIDDLEIDHEPFDNLTFEYDAARDLGLKQKDIAHIREIRQLRPLVTNQPWGIFFINFEDKKIPVGVLKRLLGGLTLKKRHSANKAEQKGWNLHDLLFISAHGKSGERELSFLHFTEENGGKNKIILKELGWDQQDTKTKLDYIAHTLKSQLAWPDNEIDPVNWREKWAGAFTSQHGAAIKTAKDLTKRLAQLATAIRKSVNEVLDFENKSGPLTNIYDNFKQTLFHNLTHDDFADMYAQTICYGLLAARIMRRSGVLVADDAALIAPLTQPFLKDLMETFLAVGGRKSKIDFNELGIDEVVDALYHADMDSVLRDFGNRNPDEDPILHFYEYFLRDYDSIKREQRGVYYTPLPVVRFIVRSVDEILKNEFGLEDGLADTSTWGQMCEKNPNIKIPPGTSPDDPFVQILDPALGTGRFLVEIIDLIEDRMKKKWRMNGKNDAYIIDLWNEYVPNHLLPRVYGFELMMAPYAIAHIKIGMKLAESGYNPKNYSGPRVHVYLTNTIEEPTGLSDQKTMHFITESLAEEARGADRIKAHTSITVVVGNPPYSGHSANASKIGKKLTFIGELIQPYFYLNGIPLSELGERNTKWLHDDYVKFIRYGQRRIEISGIGILGYINNHAYLDNPTFRGMRYSLMNSFDQINIIDLHGNANKKETAEDGSKDENVFPIKQGVSINLFCFIGKQKKTVHIDLYGHRETKNKLLNRSSVSGLPWNNIHPSPPFYFFCPKDMTFEDEFYRYTAIDNIFPVSSVGIVTARDHLTIQFTKAELEKILDRFLFLSPQEARSEFNLGNDVHDWKVADAQADLRIHPDRHKHITDIQYRPFDIRKTYYTGISRGFICRPRPEVMRHMLGRPNIGIMTTKKVEVGNFAHVFVFHKIVESHAVSLKEINYGFPLYMYPTNSIENLVRPNISDIFVRRMSEMVGLHYQSGVTPKQRDLGFTKYSSPSSEQTSLNLEDPDMGRGDLQKSFGPRDVFDYIYTVLHSHVYRERYASFLKSEFPRIPLPGSFTLFQEMIDIGRQLTALHLLNEREAKLLTQPETRFISHGDARVMKGYPKYSNGKVMINSSCHFEDVTPEVWNFHIGGYQVCEKWLKDRAGKGGKNPAPGRILTEEDILHYRRITIALRETIKLMNQIDEVINSHGGWPGAFAHS